MPSQSPQLSLAELPPIYILPSHLAADQLHELEDLVVEHGGQLTYKADEARIFLASVTQKKRAAFDLRAKGVWTEEISGSSGEPPRKRVKTTEIAASGKISRSPSLTPNSDQDDDYSSPIRPNERSGFSSADELVVIRLAWLMTSVHEGQIVPFGPHLIYSAKIIPKPADEVSPKPLQDSVTYIKATPEIGSSAAAASSRPQGSGNDGPSRAQGDANQVREKGHPSPYQPRRRFGRPSSPTLTHSTKPPKLHRTTTSEWEGKDSKNLPDPPDWVKSGNMYACCRSTFADPPNAAFIAQLESIKQSRLLTLDEIGVRAYSTSIAAIAAYPYVLQSGAEVLRLPGCDHKLAGLWEEWFESADEDPARHLDVVDKLDKNEDLQHLKLFHEIWGVGPDTARKFYFDKGWKEIDDIVEYGWTTLNRVQQIGVKFYEEFLERIPRAEVEQIAEVVQRHARSCRGIPQADWNTNRDMVTVIVGGYRRGKAASGDVDLILSHRDEDVTRDLVVDVVSSLEREGWITHTLTLNTTTSDRDQQTLPYRGEGHGHGFDSLDKALCVWQNPDFDQSKHKKNPNIHRRVDIIISAWRTVGCGILGWSGGNTFQRDIRRFVKRQNGWKFDSSGVRDRATGHVLDLESPRNAGDADNWLDREKRLMNGLGIGWRPPEERCTG